MLYSRGLLHLEQQRLGQARQDLEAAGRLFLDTGDDMGLAMVTRNLAIADWLSGRFDDAVRGFEQALAVFSQTGDRENTASVLQHLVSRS
jgi:tetratricopeptide (TPR) repeat protein